MNNVTKALIDYCVWWELTGYEVIDLDTLPDFVANDMVSTVLDEAFGDDGTRTFFEAIIKIGLASANWRELEAAIEADRRTRGTPNS